MKCNMIFINLLYETTGIGGLEGKMYKERRDKKIHVQYLGMEYGVVWKLVISLDVKTQKHERSLIRTFLASAYRSSRR